jgi:plastocyanin domain-containing protein
MIVNIVGVLLIALIVWWFWLYKPQAKALGEDEFVVVVDNGIYDPANIKLPANESVTIKFLRKDAAPCAEMLIFPDLQISETLPINKIKDIKLPAMQAGEYPFHCQMKMYRGKLTVE